MTRFAHICIIGMVILFLISIYYKDKSGPVSIIPATHGHWKNAGDLGVVCEHHKDPEDVFTIYVYQKTTNGTYEKLLDYQINPQSCDVFTSDLQAIWEDLGMISEDATFVREHTDEKDTLRRWRVQ